MENLNLQSDAGSRLSLDYIRNLKKQLGQIEQHILEGGPPDDPIPPLERDDIRVKGEKANNIGNDKEQRGSKR